MTRIARKHQRTCRAIHEARAQFAVRSTHQVRYPFPLVNFRMAQIVISFGSEQLECVKNAILNAIGGEAYAAHFTTARKVEEMAFVPTDENLESLANFPSPASVCARPRRQGSSLRSDERADAPLTAPGDRQTPPSYEGKGMNANAHRSRWSRTDALSLTGPQGRARFKV